MLHEGDDLPGAHLAPGMGSGRLTDSDANSFSIFLVHSAFDCIPSRGQTRDPSSGRNADERALVVVLFRLSIAAPECGRMEFIS